MQWVCSIQTARIQWIMGVLSPVVKWPGHESVHRPLSNAEVKNAWSYTSTSTVSPMARCLIKQRTSLHDVRRS
jgi:hypothetical protein